MEDRVVRAFHCEVGARQHRGMLPHSSCRSGACENREKYLAEYIFSFDVLPTNLGSNL